MADRTVYKSQEMWLTKADYDARVTAGTIPANALVHVVGLLTSSDVDSTIATASQLLDMGNSKQNKAYVHSIRLVREDQGIDDNNYVLYFTWVNTTQTAVDTYSQLLSMLPNSIVISCTGKVYVTSANVDVNSIRRDGTNIKVSYSGTTPYETVYTLILDGQTFVTDIVTTM